MADTIIHTKTYGCTCGYRYTYIDDSKDIYSDYYTTTFGVAPGICASCKTQTMGLVINTSEQSTHIVADDATLEAQQVPATDANGQVIMVQVGSHYELQIDQSTGAISSVEVPDYAPQMRSLTTDELNALIAQRNNDLSTLDSIAA